MEGGSGNERHVRERSPLDYPTGPKDHWRKGEKVGNKNVGNSRLQEVSSDVF